VVYLLGAFGLFAVDKTFQFGVGLLGKSQVRFGTTADAAAVAGGGASTVAAPSVSPALLGVGYIIGIRLAALQFAGSVLAWGRLVPLLMFFLGRQLHHYLPAEATRAWSRMAFHMWMFILRPIAVGGMIAGSASTFCKLRKSLT